MAEAAKLALLGLGVGPQEGDFHPLAIETSAGLIKARWYDAPGAACGVLWLGAAFDSLACRFRALGAASLVIEFRRPEDAIQRGLDAMLGIYLLREQSLTTLAVVSTGPAPSSLGDLPVFQAAEAGPEVISEWLLEQFPELRPPPQPACTPRRIQ